MKKLRSGRKKESTWLTRCGHDLQAVISESQMCVWGLMFLLVRRTMRVSWNQPLNPEFIELVPRQFRSFEYTFAQNQRLEKYCMFQQIYMLTLRCACLHGASTAVSRSLANRKPVPTEGHVVTQS